MKTLYNNIQSKLNYILNNIVEFAEIYGKLSPKFEEIKSLGKMCGKVLFKSKKASVRILLANLFNFFLSHFLHEIS